MNDSIYQRFDRGVGGIALVNDQVPARYTCSLGFNTKLSSTQMGLYDPFRHYFVTVGHCTNIWNFEEQTTFRHPRSADPNVVIAGTERRETVYRTPQQEPWLCPPGYLCASADAALVEYDRLSFDWEYGKIVKTLSSGYGPSAAMGSLAVDPQVPRWIIRDTLELAPAIGTNLHKMGWATGWTEGPRRASATCVAAKMMYPPATPGGLPTESGLVQTCTGYIDATLCCGDSGGPVFIQKNAFLNDVTLVGITWGGTMGRVAMSYYPYVSRELVHRDYPYACPFGGPCWPRLAASLPPGMYEAPPDDGGGGGGGGSGDCGEAISCEEMRLGGQRAPSSKTARPRRGIRP